MGVASNRERVPTQELGQTSLSQVAEPARFASGRWLVVKTHAHKEGVAVQSLRRLDFATYCPVVQRRVRHARRTQDVRRPLFPGYLFVDVSGEDRSWRSILYASGVSQLVKAGDRIAFVPGALIEQIKAREVDGVIRKPARAFEVGQQIRLPGGAFEGLAATIIEMDEKQRLVVLMNWLNQTVRVRVDAQKLAVC